MKKLAWIAILVSQSCFAMDAVVNFATLNEPPQANSAKSTDVTSVMLVQHVEEGLTRFDDAGAPLPGVAEKWKVTDKGATFWLRKNSKWSDGKPVTAKDFLFAWKLALDPKTASEYAFVLFVIKNGEAINQGKLPGSALGAKAIDDYTIEIEFEKPCGYFLGLTSLPVYGPIREDFYMAHQDNYAADADKMLYNGPFLLTKWVHGSSLTFVRNPNYWDQKRVKIDKIEIPYITPDNATMFNFFKDKKTDIFERLSKDDLPKAQAEHMHLRNFLDGTVWFMEFNFRPGHPTTNKNLRKAIAALFNPQEYVTKVVGIPGTKPGVRLVPTWVKGVKAPFGKEYPIAMPKQNIAEAKKYIELARKEMGGTIPPLVWLTQDQPFHTREAEYFQQLFKQVLGVDLKIDQQIFKLRLQKMTAGEFDIVSAGWGPDYPDPMTFVDLTASWNENNRGKYSNPECDKLVRIAQGTTNQKVRMDAMAKAEKIALDDVAYMPTYERSVMWLMSDRVQGVKRRVFGPDPDLTEAMVIKK